MGPSQNPHPRTEALKGGEIAEIEAHDHTSETDAYSRAYSAPESEHFTSAPYMPADLRLYDYDDYDEPPGDDERRAPRWPWVVGVAAIVAAIALVVSVSLLVDEHRYQQARRPRHHHDHRPGRAARAGPNHDHHAAAPTATTADGHGDADGDGDTSATAARTPGAEQRGAAAGDQSGRGAPAAGDHDAGRSAASHLYGDRHQSAGRHYLGDLRRRLRPVDGPNTTCTSRGR